MMIKQFLPALVFSLFSLLSVRAQFVSNPLARNALDTVSVEAGNENPHNTTFTLITERETFVPGEEVWIGARFEMEPDWHIYWENPGDSGMPTTFQWDLPDGVSIGEIEWPAPVQFVEGDFIVSFGYKNEVILLIPVQTPGNLRQGESLTLSARADWLECKDICLPGSGEASITLTAGTSGGRDPRFEEVRRRIPRAFEGWRASHRVSGRDVRIRITPSEGFEVPDGDLSFFPLDELTWDLLEGFDVSRDGDGIAVRGTLQGAEFPDTLRGVLVHHAGFGAEMPSDVFKVEAGTEGAASGRGGESALQAGGESRGLAGALAGAFVAGVMLNLLPCIFPVLGLKISGFVEQAQGDSKTVKLHALVFAAGILVSLWILGAIVGALGAAWGAQFQDPRVVIALLLVLTLFTMNLFGVFELGASLTTVGGDLTQKQGYAGSFFQGVLLTVIATPCTGPFMAAMIGWMLTQTVFVGFLAFTAMGLGIAAPYVLLAFSPKLIEKLPPPGMWMVTFKQGSAFVMVLFLWVMLFVLNSLVPGAVMVRVVGAMMMIAFASWVLGTWGSTHRRASVQKIAKGLTVALLLLSGWIAFGYHAPESELTDSLRARIEAGEPVRWMDVTPELAEELLADGVPLHFQPFSPEKLDQLLAEGQRVFIDFTAEWCTICKINKFTTLHRDDVMQAFQDNHVVTLGADWTARDDIIGDFLARYGRRGVPVYLLYVPGEETRFLPEQLSPGIIFEALENL
jgi:thiol:disulfide interchange protein/DsbC/DsbD-like thiol-disulfide interchange protein